MYSVDKNFFYYFKIFLLNLVKFLLMIILLEMLLIILYLEVDRNIWRKFPLYKLPKTLNSLEPGFKVVNIKSLFKYKVKSHLLS